MDTIFIGGESKQITDEEKKISLRNIWVWWLNPGEESRGRLTSFGMVTWVEGKFPSFPNI
jgi:hypothetical protein